ncbi:MAG TPA: alpha/beta hydrolase [Chitinophaga sp.]|uniref:alpha/beta fold hydrolase n=1 Tax=Chitinophaga sp. TaxID=1869181 RepID=UPI002F932FE2
MLNRTKFYMLMAILTSALSTNAQNNNMETLKTSGHAPVNGIQMYYEIHGNDGGLPLVLIHGGGSTIETTFGVILPMLAAHNKVIAVEMQAHGRTSDRNAPETFEQDARDVAALLKYLKVDKANIMGFSDGGCTTMQLAMSHPELLNKMVVVSSNYQREGMAPGFFEGLQNATLKDMPEPLKAGFLKVTPDQDRLQNVFEKDRSRRLVFQDWPDAALQAIKTPALIMAGDKDVITTEHIVKLSRLIPGAQLIILPGVHGTLLGEICSAKKGSRQPEITATLVQEFLNE